MPKSKSPSKKVNKSPFSHKSSKIPNKSGKNKSKTSKTKTSKTKTSKSSKKSKGKSKSSKSSKKSKIDFDKLYDLSSSQLRTLAHKQEIPLYNKMTDRELISALNTDKEFTIGWRWKYMKPQLKKNEYKDAMELLLAPVRDITFYKKITNFLKNHEVHISLTTSPLRLPKILAVLATIDSTHVKNINVVLPDKYGKNKESYNQADIDKISKFPKVKIIRTAKDYGPITKMLPVIRQVKDPKSIIISIDDDVGYPLGMINEFIYQKVEKYPNAVVQSPDEGQDFRKDIGNFKKVFPSKQKPRKPYADLVEGWLGVAYSKKLVNDEEMEIIADLSKECLLSDDLVISYILAKHNVPVVKVDNKHLGQQLSYQYGAGADALHKGGGTGKVANVGAFSDDFNKEKYEICLYDIKRYF
uniref:Uncharacterized protein n=1 Tax=viral metagenome TaxID=1070528 RepID=A0A6C0I7D4_9ZZZZ